MELHAFDEMILVPEAHHLALRGSCADFQTIGKRLVVNDQRMIAHRVERIRQPGENSATVVYHRRSLAMHQARGASDVAAKRLAHALLAETYAEDRKLTCKFPEDRERDARFLRRTRSG